MRGRHLGSLLLLRNSSWNTSAFRCAPSGTVLSNACQLGLRLKSGWLGAPLWDYGTADDC
jgi:hypothetical protein